jgi:hypothetical protein
MDHERLVGWLFVGMAVLVIGYAAFAAYFIFG